MMKVNSKLPLVLTCHLSSGRQGQRQLQRQREQLGRQCMRMMMSCHDSCWRPLTANAAPAAADVPSRRRRIPSVSWSLPRLVQSSSFSSSASQQQQDANDDYQEVSYASTNANPLQVLEFRSSKMDNDQAMSPATAITDILDQHQQQKHHRNCWYLVQLIAAPWNPADVNTVQGKYPKTRTHGLINQKLQSILPWSTLQETKDQEQKDGKRIVAGSEGLGRIRQIYHPQDSNENNNDNDNPTTTEASSSSMTPSQLFQINDCVAVAWPGLGTLRSHIWLPESAMVRLFNNNNTITTTTYSMAQWSTLLQLGGTAWRLLLDYSTCFSPDSNKNNKAGNEPQPKQQHKMVVAIQNAAHSNVGYMVQQLVPILASSSSCIINVVRTKREVPLSATKQYSRHHHVNLQITEDELNTCRNTKEMWQFIQQEYTAQVQKQNNGTYSSLSVTDLPPTLEVKPQLALDAVGGDSASRLFSLLGPDGDMVTYGALSKRPMTAAAPPLIFANKRLQGHWHSQWMTSSLPREGAATTGNDPRQEMMNQLVDFVKQGKLRLPPVQSVPLKGFSKVWTESNDSSSNNGKLHEQEQHWDENGIPLPSKVKVVFECSSRLKEGGKGSNTNLPKGV